MKNMMETKFFLSQYQFEQFFKSQTEFIRK